MRVLMISRELPPVGGGAGYVALNLAAHLGRRGHEVDVVTMDYTRRSGEVLAEGVDVYGVDAGRRREDRATLAEMARFVWSARRTVRTLAGERGYDVAHAQAIVPDGIVLRSLGRGTRTVVTAHGSDVPGHNPDKYRVAHRLIRPVWRRMVRYPDMITTPSSHLRSLLLAGEDSCEVEVIPNGIDGNMFEVAQKERAFLVVSRLVPAKNVHLLMQALRKVEEPTTIHIVGDGPERARLERLGGDLEAHTVHFHGWLEHGSPKWRTLYERCYFFVSLSSNENFPINLLEAQLARMVVLASDIPGNREVLGESARYVRELSVDEVQEAIRELQSLPYPALEAEGGAAQDRVLDTFSWERITDAFIEVYEGDGSCG